MGSFLIESSIEFLIFFFSHRICVYTADVAIQSSPAFDGQTINGPLYTKACNGLIDETNVYFDCLQLNVNMEPYTNTSILEKRSISTRSLTVPSAKCQWNFQCALAVY